MEKGIHDIATDLLKQRLNTAIDMIKKQYKGKKLYRKEPPDPRAQLYYYINEFTPQVEIQSRQSFGDGVIDTYKMNMESLRLKFNSKG